MLWVFLLSKLEHSKYNWNLLHDFSGPPSLLASVYFPWSPAYFPWSPVYVSPAPDKPQSIMEDTQMSIQMEDLYNYKVGLGFYFCIIYKCILVKRVVTHLKHWLIISLQWRHGSAHLLQMKIVFDHSYSFCV